MQKKSMHILLSLLKANNFKYYKWSVQNEPTIFYCYNITEQEQKNNADKQRYFFRLLTNCPERAIYYFYILEFNLYL